MEPPTSHLQRPARSRSGVSLRKAAGGVFHAVEKFWGSFPRHGKKFSMPWKKRVGIFHAMEKNAGSFPCRGKKFSMLWKTGWLLAAAAWGGEGAPAAPWSMEWDGGAWFSAWRDADGNERERAAGPFWERAEGADGMSLRATPRPLYARAADPATDRASWDAAWPLAAGKRFGEQVSWRVLVAYYLDQDRTDAEARYRFWLLPVWFHGRDDDGAGYAALFPLGGEIRNVLWKDRVRFFLWPLWASSQVNEVHTTDVLFPIYSRTTSADGHLEKFRVLPFYSYAKNERQFVKRAVLWPVWNHARYVHPQAEGTAWVLFPVCGRINLNSQKGWMFLPPFFQHVRGEKVSRTFFPWPFFQRETGERERLEVWPLYGRREEGPLKRQFWLWPLVSREENDWGRRHVVRWSVVPFWLRATYSENWLPSERKAAEERGEELPEARVRGRREKLWPLYSRRSDLDADAFRFRAPDLWPGPTPSAVERSWAPIWTLAECRGQGENRDFELLWGTYRWTRREGGGRMHSLFPLWKHERAAEDEARRWSVLKGLIAYDRTATNREVRFLWAGRVRLAARGAGSAEEP